MTSNWRTITDANRPRRVAPRWSHSHQVGPHQIIDAISRHHHPIRPTPLSVTIPSLILPAYLYRPHSYLVRWRPCRLGISYVHFLRHLLQDSSSDASPSITPAHLAVLPPHLYYAHRPRSRKSPSTPQRLPHPSTLTPSTHTLLTVSSWSVGNVNTAAKSSLEATRWDTIPKVNRASSRAENLPALEVLAFGHLVALQSRNLLHLAAPLPLTVTDAAIRSRTQHLRRLTLLRLAHPPPKIPSSRVTLKSSPMTHLRLWTRTSSDHVSG